MNTVQKYAGKGVLQATSTESAQNTAKPSPTQDKWNPSKNTLLQIKIWYDGKEGEFNLTAPNFIWGDFIELQYYYLRQYFKKVGVWMKLESYQASLCGIKDDGTIRVYAQYEKIMFSPEDAFASGQYCDCVTKTKDTRNTIESPEALQEKKGVNNG